MAEYHAAERPRKEPDPEGRERQQQPGFRFEFWKEQVAEHQRGRGTVDEKIVPLQCRTDRRRHHDSAVRSIHRYLPVIVLRGRTRSACIASALGGSGYRTPACAASCGASQSEFG